MDQQGGGDQGQSSVIFHWGVKLQNNSCLHQIWYVWKFVPSLFLYPNHLFVTQLLCIPRKFIFWNNYQTCDFVFLEVYCSFFNPNSLWRWHLAWYLRYNHQGIGLSLYVGPYHIPWYSGWEHMDRVVRLYHDPPWGCVLLLQCMHEIFHMDNYGVRLQGGSF